MIKLQNIASYSGIIILQKALGFLMVPFIAANLSIENFGLANTAITITGIITLLIIFGCDEAIIKKKFLDHANEDKYLTNGLINVFISSSIILFFILLAMGYNLLRFLAEDSTIILIAFINAFLNSFFIIYQKLLRISEDLEGFALLTLLNIFIQVTSIFLFVVIFQFGILGYLLSFTLPLASCLILFFKKKKSNINLKLINKDTSISLFVFGAKITPHTLSTWLLFGFTVVFLNTKLGPKYVSELITNNYVPTIAFILSQAFFYVFQPWLYRQLKGRIFNKDFFLVVFGSVVIFCLILLFLYIFSSEIFSVLFRSKYFVNSELMFYLCLACLIQFIASLMAYFLYFYEKFSYFLGISTVIGGAMNIVILTTFVVSSSILPYIKAYTFCLFMMMMIRIISVVFALINSAKSSK